jgi:hypothetical protein
MVSTGSDGLAARALIGWMDPEAARTALGAAANDPAGRIGGARDTVARRAPLADRDEAVQEPGDALARYGEALLQTPGLDELAATGWRTAVVDMRFVCPLHPVVVLDGAGDRVGAAQADDAVSLARASLPVPVPAKLPVQHDPVHHTWTISSANPNLRILDSFAGQSPLGMRGFGFNVGITPSFVQVGRVGHRLLLRDGHHRVLGLLKRGITTIPALVRSFGSLEELEGPADMLPREVLFGDRPPTLPDFLDDAVSAAVTRPAARKVIIIQALEAHVLD